MMKKSILLVVLIIFSIQAQAQMLTRAYVESSVTNVCDRNNTYKLLPAFDKNQFEAICPLGDQKLIEKLNNEITAFNDGDLEGKKVSIEILINCRGEAVWHNIKQSSGSDLFDTQLLQGFQSLGNWKSGRLEKKNVDSVTKFNFKIENGLLLFN